jgi:hypothetical protein
MRSLWKRTSSGYFGTPFSQVLIELPLHSMRSLFLAMSRRFMETILAGQR